MTLHITHVANSKLPLRLSTTPDAQEAGAEARACSGTSRWRWRRDASLVFLRHEPLDPVEQLADDAEPADPCEGHHGRENAAGDVLVAPREVTPDRLQGISIRTRNISTRVESGIKKGKRRMLE